MRVRGIHLLAAASVVCAATLAAALPAQASARIGWVWASNPTSASYTPNSAYSYNSKFDANTITRSGTGDYEVTMAGLYSGTEASNVQVTAYNTNGYCQTDGWGHTGSNVTISVRCFNASGAAADSDYNVLYESHSGNTGTASKGLGFVWNGSASESSTPSATYSYNSTGGTNTVTHDDTGAYHVALPGLTTRGGDVQVTAYGSSAARCKVLSWDPVSGAQNIYVLCFDGTGAPADEQFDLSYVIGDTYAEGTPSTNYQAYAFANKPKDHTSYVPEAPYNYSNLKTGHLTALATSTGHYTVTIPGSVPAYSTSNYLVTAYGDGSSYCNVVDWDTSTVDIACYAQGGTKSSEDYDVSFQAWE